MQLSEKSKVAEWSRRGAAAIEEVNGEGNGRGYQAQKEGGIEKLQGPDEAFWSSCENPRGGARKKGVSFLPFQWH